ncbi:MAG: glutamyl-tRNA reductase [Anaerolineae bacterium]|nr:MAG: glutamyl-tRNA reductase [Anaerolineae bacterium]
MITLLGVSFKTAPLTVREQVAFAGEQLRSMLIRLSREGCEEVVLLCTCNRTEIYAVGAPQDTLRRFLHQTCSLSHKVLLENFYSHENHVAVRHLFTVAAGLDSMLLGEPQILGQVKRALETAAEAHTVGPVLHRLFQEALHVGKQVRSRTRIGQHHLSIGQAAADLARSFFDGQGVQPRRVLIIGAGEMATLVARGLTQNGMGPVIVANRTYRRAQALAEALGGEAIRFEQVEACLPRVDVVVCASGAPHLVLYREQVQRALKARDRRPLFLIDIAVPRDIEATVAGLPGVELYNIDDLKGVCDRALRHRQQEADRALVLITEAAGAFMEWLQRRRAAPLLRRLQEQAEAVRQAEVEKALRRLGDLRPEQREVIQALSRALVKKVLRSPVLQLQTPVSTWPCPRYPQCAASLLNIPFTPSLQEVSHEIQHSRPGIPLPATGRR